MAKIRINGITVDSETDAEVLRRLGAEAEARGAEQGRSKYLLIEAYLPLDRGAKRQLENEGVRILEFVPDHAYLARADGVALERIDALPFVRLAIAYPPELKVAPALCLGNQSETASLAEIVAAEGPATTTCPLITVALHADVDPGTARERVARAAGVDVEAVELCDGKLNVLANGASLVGLALLDEMKTIDKPRR